MMYAVISHVPGQGSGQWGGGAVQGYGGQGQWGQYGAQASSVEIITLHMIINIPPLS